MGRRPVRELPRRGHPPVLRAGLRRRRGRSVRGDDQPGQPQRVGTTRRHHHDVARRRRWRPPACRPAPRTRLRRGVFVSEADQFAVPPRHRQYPAVSGLSARRASVPVSNDPDHRQLLWPACDCAARRAGAVRRDRQGKTGSGRPLPRAVLCAGSGRGTVVRRHRPSRRLGRLVELVARVPDRQDVAHHPGHPSGSAALRPVRRRRLRQVESDHHRRDRRFRTARNAQLVLPCRRRRPTRPDLEWSELVTTDVFNSNKCFAVFKEGSQR